MQGVQLLAKRAENLLSQHGRVSHGVINYEQPATGKGAGVNVFINLNNDVILNTEDGDHRFTFGYNPRNPTDTEANIMEVDNLKTGEYIVVNKKNMNAFAHYLLGFFVEI